MYPNYLSVVIIFEGKYTMAVRQRFGIKYPFSSENNEEIYLDLDDNIVDATKSKVLHVVFTPKGQRLRNPDFGTDLIKYIFEQSDDITYEHLKEDIRSKISKYVPEVSFEDIEIYDDDKSEHGKIVMVSYSVTRGQQKDTTTVAVRI